MTLTKKILIGILSVLVIINSIVAGYEITKTIQTNRELAQKVVQANDRIIKDIYQQLDTLNKKIDNIPGKIIFNKFKSEQILKQVTVMIKNITLGALGSGVSIKYKGKFYVLTAGHMTTVVKPGEQQDSLELWENGNKVCDLEVVKHDFTTPEEDANGDFTKGTDLLLLRPKNTNIQPRFYTEVATYEPLTGTQVYIVGNPMGIEDVISDGRIIIYHNNFMYYIDHTYFGNSGGGVYSQDGKLVGIVSHMNSLQPDPNVPPYMIYGAVRIEVIQQFLADVK